MKFLSKILGRKEEAVIGQPATYPEVRYGEKHYPVCWTGREWKNYYPDWGWNTLTYDGSTYGRPMSFMDGLKQFENEWNRK